MSDTFGLGDVIPFEGQQYPFPPADLKSYGKFARWLKALAFSDVEEMRGTVPDVIYKERLNAVAETIAARRLDYGSEAYEAALSSRPGSQYLFYLRLAQARPTVTQELATRIWESEYARCLQEREAAVPVPN